MNILINRKVDYALRVLSLLASSDRMVTTSEMSVRLQISRVFLAKIVNELAKNGIIGSKKGKSGGIILKDPRTSLKKIVLMFDPDISFNKCLKKGFTCFLGRQCLIHKVLAKAQADLFSRLDSISVGSIALKGRN